MTELKHNLLIGPLYEVSLLGDYLYSDRIKTFTIHSEQSLVITQAYTISNTSFDYCLDLRHDTFDDLLAHLDSDWQPDLVIWFNLGLQAVPLGIERCPYPTAVIVHDWHLSFQSCLDYLSAFDYILSDQGFLNIIRSQGIQNCDYWPCYSYDPQKFMLLEGRERIYDIAFIGHTAFSHSKRTKLLTKVMKAFENHNIFVSSFHYNYDYVQVLNQSKIVFNQSLRGEMNLRAYEATACGALLLMEEDNLEIHHFLKDGESCVLYNEENIIERIRYYLDHPEERERIALQGYIEIQKHSYHAQFKRLIAKIPEILSWHQRSMRQFSLSPEPYPFLYHIKKQVHSRTPAASDACLQQLEDHMATYQDEQTIPTEILNAFAVILLEKHQKFKYFLLQKPSEGHPHFKQAYDSLAIALKQKPDHPIYQYNMAIVCLLLNQYDLALQLLLKSLMACRQQNLAAYELDSRFVYPMGSKLHTDFFSLAWQEKSYTYIQNPEQKNQAYIKLMESKIWEVMGLYYTYCDFQLEKACECILYAYRCFPENHRVQQLYLQSLIYTGQIQDYETQVKAILDDQPFYKFLWVEYCSYMLKNQKYELLRCLIQDYKSIFDRNSWDAGIFKSQSDLLSSIFKFAETKVLLESQPPD